VAVADEQRLALLRVAAVPRGNSNSGALYDMVPQNSKSFDLDLHHVAGLQKHRRLSKHTHTIGRAGRDDVAGL
jgi:hypothetical protein